MISPDRIRFLGIEHSLAFAQTWIYSDWPKLRLHNAYYFDNMQATDFMWRAAWHRALLAGRT